MDKFLTNYQEDVRYYVVLDNEDDVYMKFKSHTEAIQFYTEMVEIHQHTGKKFFLTQVIHTVVLHTE